MPPKRIIVAQPPSLCRAGEGLLQVGVMPWMRPPRRVTVDGTRLTLAAEPMMTFIVKATFSYAHCTSPEDEMTLAPEPEGLSLDVPSELPGAAEDELAYSSDFVPLKRDCDVLLTGHATSRRPSKLLPAAIRLGKMERSFAVASDAMSVRIPLIAEAIRDLAGNRADPVGPRLTPPLLEEHPYGFDFAAYNTAPPSQQLEEIPHAAPLTLTGLSERADILSLKLPAVRPRIWVDTDRALGAPLRLLCDTVWLDTDRQLCVLVYRTDLPIPSFELDGIAQVTLAMAPDGEVVDLKDVQAELDRGVFEGAVLLSDFDDDAASADDSLFAKYSAWRKPVEPALSLAAYAAIGAELAENRQPRHDTLKSHGMDDDSFLVEERGWLTRISEAALRGDPSLAARYGELLVAAQDRLAGPGEGKESLAEYAALKVDVEDAPDPTKLLEERRMTLAEWMRMDRRWTRRAMEDAAVEAEIKRRCAAYRARAGTGGLPAGEGAADRGLPPGKEG
ncbi:MAG: DUF2169 domain-containing protein [Polyangiaceae bacterium]